MRPLCLSAALVGAGCLCQPARTMYGEGTPPSSKSASHSHSRPNLVPAKADRGAASPSFAANLPPERAAVARQAHALLADWQAGRLRLTVANREGEQLRRLERDGLYRWPPPHPVSSVTISPLPFALGLHDALCRMFLPGSAPALLETLRAVHHLPSRNASPTFRMLAAAVNDVADSAPVPPMPGLMRLLTTLAAKSTPAHPLELMTLLRPPYATAEHPHGSAHNVHSLGQATDIAAFAGHRIAQADPEGCVQMTLALLRAMPPGRYRLGMPKAPELPAVVGQPHFAPELMALLAEILPPNIAALPPALPVLPPIPFRVPVGRDGKPLPVTPAESVDHIAQRVCALGIAIGAHCGRPPKFWPFFPAQEFALEKGVVAPKVVEGKTGYDRSGKAFPRVMRFLNEDYAPADALADGRLRTALKAARKRGVEVYALFPDAADHVHIDLRPQAKTKDAADSP